MGKYVIPARRKKGTPGKKSKSKSKSRSKSKPRDSQPIKKHLRSRTAKYVPPHRRKNKKQKSRKQRSKKKEVAWENDWNWPPKIKSPKKSVMGLPVVNPPSPSSLPQPLFQSKMKPHNSELSPVNFTSEEMNVIKTVLEDAFKPSPKKLELLTPNDLMKSKVNRELLRPQDLLSKNVGKGTKSRFKKKRRKNKTKKRRKH